MSQIFKSWSLSFLFLAYKFLPQLVFFLLYSTVNTRKKLDNTFNILLEISLAEYPDSSFH